jgi:hypothetical protein
MRPLPRGVELLLVLQPCGALRSAVAEELDRRGAVIVGGLARCGPRSTPRLAGRGRANGLDFASQLLPLERLSARLCTRAGIARVPLTHRVVHVADALLHSAQHRAVVVGLALQLDLRLRARVARTALADGVHRPLVRGIPLLVRCDADQRLVHHGRLPIREELGAGRTGALKQNRADVLVEVRGADMAFEPLRFPWWDAATT